MFNITGGELIIIAVVALIILGPDKLPDFLRRAGRVYGEVKKMSSGFKTEFRDAIEEPVREMQDTVNLAKGWFEEGKTAVGTMDDSRWGNDDDEVAEPTAVPPVATSSVAPAESAHAATPGDSSVAPAADAMDDGDGPDVEYSDADDDPNFYDDEGRLITAADLVREHLQPGEQEPAQDLFGSVTRRPEGEGPTA